MIPAAHMVTLSTQDHTPPSFWRSRYGIGWLVLAGIAGWFLWTEHRAHLFGALPWLVLLACPLMHLFMHRGHHGHHGQGNPPGPSDARARTPAPRDNAGGAP
jgi:hypothetical protein